MSRISWRFLRIAFQSSPCAVGIQEEIAARFVLSSLSLPLFVYDVEAAVRVVHRSLLGSISGSSRIHVGPSDVDTVY